MGRKKFLVLTVLYAVSVLIEFVCGFVIFDDFFYGFTVSNS